jgi:UDP-galactopyranose mutase
MAHTPHYDYLIAGSGLSGAVFAHQASAHGKKCLVLEKRPHIGGNLFCENIEGIPVHRYGAHIFHTDSERVWQYLSSLTDLSPFLNTPLANYQGKLFNLPFNMHTFYQMWGIKSPQAARAKLREETTPYTREEKSPANLEEQALRLVGPSLYETLVKGYTEKQWGRSCRELPAFIIKRLPLRFTFDNNYFTSRYQGIPRGGYTPLIEKLLEGVEVRVNTDFLEDREGNAGIAEKVVYTGRIDGYYGEKYGALEYRSLRFETEVVEEEDHQGVGVMNYTDREPEYTRVIEHKHFMRGEGEGTGKTVVTWEYPAAWEGGQEPYYPVNDEKNAGLYARYAAEGEKEKGKVIFLGRLARYAYLDMDQAIGAALEAAEKELG